MRTITKNHPYNKCFKYRILVPIYKSRNQPCLGENSIFVERPMIAHRQTNKCFERNCQRNSTINVVHSVKIKVQFGDFCFHSSFYLFYHTFLPSLYPILCHFHSIYLVNILCIFFHSYRFGVISKQTALRVPWASHASETNFIAIFYLFICLSFSFIIILENECSFRLLKNYSCSLDLNKIWFSLLFLITHCTCY